MSTVEAKPITAAEFFRMPDLGPCELVRGKIVAMNPPSWFHGNIGIRIGHYLEDYLEENDIGQISGMDSGVVTVRDPDTVRGADVCYYSYARLPVTETPEVYPVISPEIIWEVRSPGNRWKELLIKVSEYLEAGVLAVCVVDPKEQCLLTYYADKPNDRHNRGDVWTNELLPGFELPVDKVFRRRRS